jgi:hypothetical protein
MAKKKVAAEAARKPKQKPAPSPPAEPEGTVVVPETDAILEMSVNGHILTGRKAYGAWVFNCDDWPDLAAMHRGDLDPIGVIADFMAKALAGAVAVPEAAADPSLFADETDAE